MWTWGWNFAPSPKVRTTDTIPGRKSFCSAAAAMSQEGRALPGGLVEFSARTKFSRLFEGFTISTTRSPEGKVPDYIKALEGDDRGHEGEREEQAEMEAAFEKVLEAAEGRARESVATLDGSPPNTWLVGRVGGGKP